MGLAMQLNNFQKVTVILNILGITLLVFLFGLVAHDYFRKSSSSIAVIDMKKAINNPVIMITKAKLSEESKSKLIESYSHLLPRVIRSYGIKNHPTVVSMPVLYSGNESDITKVIINKTLSEVKKNHAKN